MTLVALVIALVVVYAAAETVGRLCRRGHGGDSAPVWCSMPQIPQVCDEVGTPVDVMSYEIDNQAGDVVTVRLGVRLRPLNWGANEPLPSA